MAKPPTVTIKNRDISFTVKPAFSLLNNLLMEKIPVQTECGGRAKCGRCRFKVFEGSAHISPVREAEINRLGEKLIKAGWRLGCQAHAIRDITIELPSLDEDLA